MEQRDDGDEKDDPPTRGAKRKKKRGKLIVVAGVLVVVLAVAGGGFWVWHNDPSFCGTMCHDTMGSYTEGYENAKGDDLLVSKHAEAGVTCLDCHEATIEDQVTELGKQLSGDYRVPFKKMETEDGFCLREGCHDLADVQKKETVVDANGVEANPHTQSIDASNAEHPHESADGKTLECSECHTVHRSSAELDQCYSCHHTETFQSCSNCHDDK